MRKLLVPVLFCALVIAESACADAKKEVEILTNAMMPIATQMLEKHHAVFPYGGALTTAGKIVRVSSYDKNQRPNSSAVIKGLRQAFHAGADVYRATALFYDVQVRRPDTGVRTNAIAVALDHTDGYSALVFFPYKIVKGRVEVAAAFSTPGSNAIFGK